MIEVKALSVKIGDDDKFILLKSELDENFTNENLFHFVGDWACGNARALCDLVADNKIIEVTTPAGKYLEMDVAKIGNKTTGYRHALLVGYDCEKSLDYVFGFSCEEDANTAYRLVERCFELAHADEDADENERQDAYDNARHVYDAAIANGCSEQDARAKASRVLDEQLKK